MFLSLLLSAGLLLQLSFNDGPVSGVAGNAAFFDGFDSRIVIPAGEVPPASKSFAVDVWVCPVAFPKSPCPVVCRVNNERPDGWSLWLDALGRVHFSAACAGRWVNVESKDTLPLREWSRLTCFFRSGEGLFLAIDGKEQSFTPLESPSVNMAEYPVYIGRTPVRTPSFFENKSIPIYSSFDGAIDELCVFNDKTSYKRILSEKFLRPDPPAFEERRLPSGPSDLAFGAWYIPLKYYRAFDERWRGDTPDVVVGFGGRNPSRVVFWRGISYAPCFVTEKDNWMCNEFVERKKVTGWGCPESMSDKHADFSSVRILENSPARTVILWRNAPVGVNQVFPFQSEETQWGDWSEETYIFYPDGVGVRKMDVWSSNLDDWYEWCQSLQVLHPDQRPEDVLDAEKIMSVAAMDGRSRTFGWDFEGKARQHEASIEGANIQVTYLKSRWNPFLILDDRAGANENGHDGPEICRYAGRWSEFSDFPWRNHWPVAQDYVIGRYACVADAASHTYTATQYNACYYRDERKMTKLMLCGCTDKDAAELVPLAKSWLRNPDVSIDGKPLGYDLTQRAYICPDTTGAEGLKLSVTASKASPVCGLCIIFENWNKEAPSKVEIDGNELKDWKAGIVKQYDSDKLVLWMDVSKDSPFEAIIK